MDFHLAYLTPLSTTRCEIVRSEDDLLERTGSGDSYASSSSYFGGATTKGGRVKVPPSPVSVMGAFGFQSHASSRCSSRDLSSPTPGSRASFSRSCSLASEFPSKHALESIDESFDELADDDARSSEGGAPDPRQLRLYSRQSSSRSLVSNDSAQSASSVDWLNCYATSVLCPDLPRPAQGQQFSTPTKAGLPALSDSASGCSPRSLSGFTPSPRGQGGRPSPEWPRRSRKQLACQLDDLIASMDTKIRERRGRETLASSTTSSSASGLEGLGGGGGEESEEEDDHDHEAFMAEVSEERELMRSMESLWFGA